MIFEYMDPGLLILDDESIKSLDDELLEDVSLTES